MRKVRWWDDGMHFLRSFTLTRLINLLKAEAGYAFSLFVRRPVVSGLPYTLSAEPATACNLSCPECPVGNGSLSRPKGTMSFELFREIIDQIHRHLLHLILYFQGEPFLAPGLFRMIRYAKERKIYVSTSTNGHFLDRKNIDEILSSGLDRLIVSLDGAEQESYAKYRRGGDLARVVRGVHELISRRAERGTRRPYVILQSLMLQHNLGEREKIERLAQELGADRLEFKTAQFYDLSGDNGMIPPDSRFSRYVPDGQGGYRLKYRLKNRCHRLWTTSVITWDGRVVPCCFDKDAEHEMGNMAEIPFSRIWKNVDYQRFREQILTARAAVPMCRNCTEGLA